MVDEWQCSPFQVSMCSNIGVESTGVRLTGHRHADVASARRLQSLSRVQRSRPRACLDLQLLSPSFFLEQGSQPPVVRSRDGSRPRSACLRSLGVVHHAGARPPVAPAAEGRLLHQQHSEDVDAVCDRRCAAVRARLCSAVAAAV